VYSRDTGRGNSREDGGGGNELRERADDLIELPSSTRSKTGDHTPADSNDGRLTVRDRNMCRRQRWAATENTSGNDGRLSVRGHFRRTRCTTPRRAGSATGLTSPGTGVARAPLRGFTLQTLLRGFATPAPHLPLSCRGASLSLSHTPPQRIPYPFWARGFCPGPRRPRARVPLVVWAWDLFVMGSESDAHLSPAPYEPDAHLCPPDPTPPGPLPRPLPRLVLPPY
jgi:hypothetical protein